VYKLVVIFAQISCYLRCSVICVVLCIVCVQICTVLLPSTVNPFAVDKYRVTQKKGNFWKTQQKLKKSKKKIYWQKLNQYNLPF